MFLKCIGYLLTFIWKDEGWKLGGPLCSHVSKELWISLSAYLKRRRRIPHVSMFLKFLEDLPSLLCEDEGGEQEDPPCCPVSEVLLISSSMNLKRRRSRAGGSSMLSCSWSASDLFPHLFEKTKEESGRIPHGVLFLKSASDIFFHFFEKTKEVSRRTSHVTLLLKCFEYLHSFIWKDEAGESEDHSCCLVSQVPRISSSIYLRKRNRRVGGHTHVALFLRCFGYLPPFLREDEGGEPEDPPCCPVSKELRISSSIYLRRRRRRTRGPSWYPISKVLRICSSTYLRRRRKRAGGTPMLHCF